MEHFADVIPMIPLGNGLQSAILEHMDVAKLARSLMQPYRPYGLLP